VAASDGVTRYINGTWLLNGLEDGLPSIAAYDIYQDNRGVVWAGTARGFSRYSPDADLDPPRTRITNPNAWTDFYTDEPILLGLSGRDKWNFTTPGRLLFSYRLDNFRWLPFDRENAVSLNDITPGNHRFEARTMDRNGNIDSTGAVYEFSVILPWYLETRLLVIALCGLSMALFFAGLAINRHLRLQRSYQEIERTVAQRTRELEVANQALLHSQKMRALGTLAAGIAHDFNSILSIIKGSAQIIEDHLEDKDKIHTRISRIKTVVDQGAGIVKSLLGFSRVTEEALAPVQINRVVEETLKILGDRFLPGISFQCELAADLPEVACAKDLLQQMLLNLVMNAADAMNGQGQILLRTTLFGELPPDLVLPPAPAKRYVAIIVKDSGCGIVPEIKSRIFEPFFTTKAFSSRHGTGLGLSMVYEFSKGLEYGLHVESQSGLGSAFMILMPVRDT
jgi:signal transduction histidine kinase